LNSGVNDLNGAKRLNDWNGWNWLRNHSDVPDVARQEVTVARGIVLSNL